MTTGSFRPTAALTSCALVAAVLAALPTAHAAAAGARHVALATPGTTLPVTFDAVAGGNVLFSTEQALVAADNDTNLDVYAWNDGATTLMTPQSPYDVFFDAAARDGAMVIGTTRDTPVGKQRIYRYTSTSAQSVNDTTGAYDATYEAVSPDGNQIAFDTAEDFGDPDNHAVDVVLAQFDPSGTRSPMLEMSSGTTADVSFAGASTDVLTVFFETDQAVLPSDLNATTDVYAEGAHWGPPSPFLVTDGTGGADRFVAASSNGVSVIFETNDNDAAGDTDSLQDLYYSEGAGLGLMSGGTTAGAVFAGASADAKTVVYSTTAQAVVADTDASNDVYAHVLDGTDVLLSGGTADQDAFASSVSPDATAVVLSTKESLSGTDTDTATDVYRATSGGVTLLSGQGTADANPVGATADGDVYFAEGLDVYANEGGVITSISPGTPAGDKSFEGASADGSVVAFSSPARLTSSDTDDLQDIYAFGSFTAGSGPPPPDTTPPTGKLAAEKKQKSSKKLVATVSCGPTEACRITLTGQVTADRKRLKVGPLIADVAAGSQQKVTLKLSKKVRKAVSAALKKGGKVKATLSATAADGAGNSASLNSVKVKLTH